MHGILPHVILTYEVDRSSLEETKANLRNPGFQAVCIASLLVFFPPAA